jgi:transcriptional regulator with XRE-family HTH domain
MPTRRRIAKRNMRLPSRKRVGRFIKKRRLELNLTQQDVMRALGYGSPISVSEVELGRVGVPIKRIYQYADVLRIPRNEFIAFVMGGMQNRNGHQGGRATDDRRRVLGPAERKLLEDFRRLPTGCRKLVRKQIRHYLAPQRKQLRVLRGRAAGRRLS